MKESILLIGGGGHARSIIDTILAKEEFEIMGILDRRDKIGEKINGIKIIDTDENLQYYYDQGVQKAFICLGSVGIPTIRSRVYKKVEKVGFELVNIIDPTAIIAKDVHIGKGNYIGKGAIINANCRIGNGCILNTRSTMEHDCVIEDFVHLSPSCTLCGGVKIGAYTHIGAGSVIIEQRQIGSHTIIGAGSVIVKDIDNEVKAYGNPCRAVEKAK